MPSLKGPKGLTKMRPNKLFAAFSLMTISGLGALLTGGCVDNRTTLFINHVAAFEPGGECEIDLGLSVRRGLISGNYNPTLGNPYYAWLVVANGLQPLGDNDTLRPETSRIQLQGAEMSINGVDGSSAFPAFTVNFAATIAPDDSEDPGLAAISVPLIPAGTGLAAGEYLVDIELFGETLGGTDVESGRFSFPVRVTSSFELISCDTVDTIPEDFLHPCGALAQDGYFYPCGSDPVNPGCIDACGP